MIKLIIPKLLEQNNILKVTDELSYAKYIQCQFQEKNEIEIESNILIYVTKGKKIIHLNFGDYVISEGDFLFLKSGNYVMSEVLDESYEALLFFYNDMLLIDFVNKYGVKLDTLNKELENNIFKIDKTLQLENSILSIVPYFEDNFCEEKNIIKLKFEEIFLNILNSDSASIFKSFLSLIYTDDAYFKSKIEQECLSFDSVSDMAKSFKMSELNFRDKFKSMFGITPKKWLLGKKLQKARILLQNSSLNVTEVCMEIGFDNISWFTQSFKKEFGVTPKQLKTNKT